MTKLVKRLGVAAVGERFHLDEIGRILEMLRENGVTEFRLEREGEKLSVKRGTDDRPAQIVSTDTSTMAVTDLPSPPQPVMIPQPAHSIKLHEVRSPMVGTFYRRPAVDADPYVEIGDMVKKGDVLCIVEAMKLMNEIESDVSGRIVEIGLEDGTMAEYGEVLFRIETTSAS